MARIKYFDSNDNTWKYADNVLQVAPVSGVNGKTGAVQLSASDVGAEEEGAVSSHNSNETAHPHILTLISALEGKAMLKSDISIKKAQLTLEDGSAVLIDVVVTSEGTTILSYTNQVPVSIDTDGSIYHGTGYQDNYRLSSSGAIKELNGSTVSGFIPVKAGDVVRIYGARWACTDHGNNYICAYDTNFTYIGGYIPNTEYVYGSAFVESLNRTSDYDGIVTLNSLETVAYIRVSSRGLSIEDSVTGEDMIITVNEEIT